MTLRVVIFRAIAAIAAGAACQVTYGEAPSPIVAAVTGEAIPGLAPGGVPRREALTDVNPSLSLLPEGRVAFPSDLNLGESESRPMVSLYNPLVLGTNHTFGEQVAFITRQPDLFDRVGDYFGGLDVEWATGTQSSVYLMAFPPTGEPQLIPFIDLLQDADEVDAHLRMGAGVGLRYQINRSMTLDAEVLALEDSGENNPATSSETRWMLVFSMRF